VRKCIATVSISGTLPDKLDAIATARFDAIEVFENDLINFVGTPGEVRRMAADRGLGIDLYQPFRDLDTASDAQFRRNLDRAERKFDLMQVLGAPMLLVCSNASPGASTDDARISAQLNELAERAARRNLRIAYEALAWGRHVKRYRHAWSIVERANHPHLGVAVDSFHILSLGDDPGGIAQIPGEKIFFLQMADAPRLAMDVLQWSRHYRCFPGQGQFDLARFLECVLVAGYTGPFSLEIFNDLLREAPNRGTAIDAMRSVLYCEAETRLRLQRSQTVAVSPPGHTSTLKRVELFDPPAAPTLAGVAFLEFAMDEASGLLFDKFLQAFGFHRAGRHRSKSVTLYRQGAIHLILNLDPNSFAREYFDEHGPSLVAVGLATDDSVRALNRATALQCTRFDSAVGLREYSVPAIRAPDDTLVYFVPGGIATGRLFEVASDPAASAGEPSITGAGLTRIDHVARGLPIEALDTWILFHRAVLGMEPGESLELSDPFGLVRSCGVANVSQTVRVVLNVSNSRGTQMAKTLAVQGGATIHHIAFACSDIFATVEKLKAGGAAFVPISDNYYDDLAARFEMDAAVLTRMRALDILFDRAVNGEYFHAYSESFAERFFFEIVQRVGTYDGYGAVNAPARLASQVQRTGPVQV
jgi:4-hydroxyphenylpyruvate dioxygenase